MHADGLVVCGCGTPWPREAPRAHIARRGGCVAWTTARPWPVPAGRRGHERAVPMVMSCRHDQYSAGLVALVDQLMGSGESTHLTPQSGGSARGARVRVISSTSSVSALDRKSTRLNSSHANISYAVFCLKKKKN